MSQTIFRTSSAIIHTDRPTSSMERAREFAQKLKARTRPPADPVLSGSLDGDLVVFREHIAGLDGRLADVWTRAVDRAQEPHVGDILDCSRACTGHLYDVRDGLAK